MIKPKLPIGKSGTEKSAHDSRRFETSARTVTGIEVAPASPWSAVRGTIRQPYRTRGAHSQKRICSGCGESPAAETETRMRVSLHSEKDWGLVLDVWTETPDEVKRLSEFVEQPGRLIFQCQSWNVPTVGPGCSFASIAMLASPPRPWYIPRRWWRG